MGQKVASHEGDSMTAWAYIAHKGGYWAGICSAEVSPRFLKKFFGEFAGFQIELVDSREAYLSKIKSMKIWHESPEYKAKHVSPQKELPL